MRQSNVAISQDPLSWWKSNGDGYPHLREVAKRYLAAPSTSVPSERLFSAAGELYSDNRTRMAPEKAEMLLFLKYNLNRFNF